MKKILLVIATTIFLASLISCSKDFKVTYLEIYPTELTTEIDETAQLSFSIVYEGGDFDDPNLIQVDWQSSDASIVEVNDSGKITAKAIGLADITVTCQDMSSTCTVTVTDTIATDDDIAVTQN